MDTLHVIRLYKEKKIHDVSSKEKTIHLKCYQWYSSGNRYPVFESTESYSVLKDSIKTNFQTSFFISSINREELNVRFDDTNKYTNETDADLINCSVYPNPVKTDLTFNYELTVNAKVSFLLCDMQGRPWYSEKDVELEIGKHQQNISMTELWLGNYALYITVNGKTYKYTVIKQ